MDKENKKVLFLGPFPPPYGGIANHINLLYGSELNKIFHIIKLNINLPSEKIENVSEKQSVNFEKIYKALKKLILVLYKERPNLVYIEMNGSISCFREVLFMLIIRIFSKAKIVLHFHGVFKKYKKNFPFNLQHKKSLLNKILINFCFCLSHRVIFLSNLILDDFREVLFPSIIKKTSVIENFVDVSFFETNLANVSTVNILFVGRLSKAKGFFDVIDIVPDIVSEKTNVVFHFCGAPETDVSLKEIEVTLKCLQNQGDIVMHGLVKGEAKKKVFSEAHILLFPSHDEVFPITILEGLAQGLPVITTKVGVIPSLVEDAHNGLFVDIGDTNSLKNKLLYLLDNPEIVKKMRLNNIRKASTRFDISVAVKKMKNIFDEELSR